MTHPGGRARRTPGSWVFFHCRGGPCPPVCASKNRRRDCLRFSCKLRSFSTQTNQLGYRMVAELVAEQIDDDCISSLHVQAAKASA